LRVSNGGDVRTLTGTARIGIISGTFTNLTPGTTYTVTAFVQNNVGYYYGDEVTFKTLAELPTLTTTAGSSIASTTATSGGNIISDGGGTVTARGVCWGTATSPTITNAKTSDASGTGTFTSSLTSLTENTTYYIRAYATNSAGTGYGNEVTIKTILNSGTLTDIEGNVYKYVTIGTQVWMAENLKTTKYNDGSAIPLVTDYNTWGDLKTPGYCWFNNDIFYKNTYGALYNWFAVNTGMLAPIGWHVPSDAEWSVLTTFLGYEDVAGGKMKETGTSHWKAPNQGATNTSSFTGLPGGYRDYNGIFTDLGDRAGFWTTSTANTGDAWLRELHFSYQTVNRYDWYQVHGYSVRCIKD
jgi:uncharacterized protein (TIGR02145 family)